MNYESMSDFEINKAVAEAYQLEQGGFVKQSKTPTDDGYAYHYCDSVGVYSNIGEFCGVKDYCNNPSDAWPIMLENGIAPLAENGRIYGATTDTYEYYEPRGSLIYSCEDKNPLRAAMIVFLMMSES